MPKFRLSDLSPAQIAMIRPADRAALGLDAPQRPTPCVETPKEPGRATRDPARSGGAKGPNKTEAAQGFPRWERVWEGE